MLDKPSEQHPVAKPAPPGECAAARASATPCAARKQSSPRSRVATALCAIPVAVPLADFGRTLMTMWRGVLGQFDINWAWGSAWQELSIIFFSAFSFLVQVLAAVAHSV
jgi:hypothetical protein